MKIKIGYFYVFVFAIVAVLLFFLLSERGSRNKNLPSKRITAPASAHSKFEEPKVRPNRLNVSKSYLNKLKNLKKAFTKNPKDTLSLREYADLISIAHNPEKGNEYYLRILKINPKRKDILFSLVSNYYGMRKIDQANKFNQKILRYWPNDKGALYNKGVFLIAKGKIKEAIKVWNKLIKKFPQSPPAKLALENIKRLQSKRKN